MRLASLLLRAYAAWPYRSHCGNGRHVTACRIFNPIFGAFMDEKPCPPRNLPRPPGV